uniref:maturase K n=1 Tax=Adiantum flabellulatum TaxID=872337 RepID=UPI002036722C|nr:maturase K [Adiantum flabellulatum]URH13259.1 maturase K [Adiantum flabellulatum]
MKANYGSLAKSGALRKNGDFIINKDCFLHPLLLPSEENFYLTGGKRRSHGADINLVFVARSMVAVKRLIGSVRDPNLNYLKINDSVFVRNPADGLNADLYLHPLLKMTYLILGIALFPQIGVERSSRSKMLQSIHSIFSFLEDRFPRSKHILEADLPRNLHLETLIRLFRRQIRDVSFLHLLRILFCQGKIFCEKNLHFSRGEQRESVDIPVRNFYIFEIDSLFLIPWKQVYQLRSNYFPPIDSCNIIRKGRSASGYEFEWDKASVDYYFVRSLSIHYGRWRNKFFIASEGTRYFVKKWLYYLRTLLKYHFHYRTKSNELRIKLLPTSCVSFPGYTLLARLVPKWIRVETIACFYISVLGGKEFHPKIPNSIITKTLTKQKFCDLTGRPVGKFAWVASTDNKIMNGYIRLWQVFSLYYGASTNQYRLRRLKFILKMSCDNTLAGKHRSTIRLLECKFNLETLNQILASSKFGLSSSRRVWRSTSIQSVLVEFALLDMGL